MRMRESVRMRECKDERGRESARMRERMRESMQTTVGEGKLG